MSAPSAMPLSGALNIKASQTDVLLRVLCSSSSAWKVLVYDRSCQDVLSPLMTVAELRKQGITLHMSLHARRDRVPDVPALYLLRPTQQNIELLVEDVAKGIYDEAFVHFSTPIPRPLLEDMASQLLKKGGPSAASKIMKVMDQYCDFISLEDCLFTLAQSHSFVKLNGSIEHELFQSVDEIVESLFSVCVTLGSVPLIRARSGHAAELIASRLETRLREHIATPRNLFTATNLTTRPTLIILDRTTDLAAPLLHSWSYQSLLHDLLHMSSNRVTVAVEEKSGDAMKLKNKTYDLLAADDKFWCHNAGRPFPRVAEAVQERLSNYQSEMSAVTKRGDNPDADQLATAINSLPKLQRKKKYLDTHMNIATALLKEIKGREIDAYYDIEQSLLQKQPVDKAAISALMGGGGAEDKGKGTWQDKLRFVLIYILTQPQVASEQLDAWKQSIIATYQQQQQQQQQQQPQQPNTDANTHTQSLPDISAIDYVQNSKFLNRLSSSEAAPAAPAPTTKGVLSHFGKLAESVYGGGVGLLAGVRNLLPTNSNLPITRIVEALMANKEGGEFDAYKTYDPKASRSRRTAPTPFNSAVVFVLGGGCYSEYQNLQDRAKEQGQSIVYGCTELVEPEQFAKQLAMVEEQQKQQNRAHVPVD